MLAPTPYKTATELGITENEHLLLSMFVSDARDGKLDEVQQFDMAHFIEYRSSCETAACIAGFMRITAARLDLGIYHPDFIDGLPLTPLFLGCGHPRKKLRTISDLRKADITLSEAAACTEHFLRSGVIDWPLAVEIAST